MSRETYPCQPTNLRPTHQPSGVVPKHYPTLGFIAVRHNYYVHKLKTAFRFSSISIYTLYCVRLGLFSQTAVLTIYVTDVGSAIPLSGMVILPTSRMRGTVVPSSIL